MLIDPTGSVVTAQKREIRITNPALARVASMADEAFRQLSLTVVCLACGGTPQMANHQTDTHWKMECACSVRVLTNPDRRSA